VAISVEHDAVPDVLQRAAAASVPARVIGRTGGSRLRITVAGETAIDVSIDDAERVWRAAMERYFDRRVA
jgi:hypothetical protein